MSAVFPKADNASERVNSPSVNYRLGNGNFSRRKWEISSGSEWGYGVKMGQWD